MREVVIGWAAAWEPQSREWRCSFLHTGIFGGGRVTCFILGGRGALKSWDTLTLQVSPARTPDASTAKCRQHPSLLLQKGHGQFPRVCEKGT